MFARRVLLSVAPMSLLLRAAVLVAVAHAAAAAGVAAFALPPRPILLIPGLGGSVLYSHDRVNGADELVWGA